MSPITPDVSTASDPAIAPARTAVGQATPPAPTFKRPIAPEPNTERDNELLNYYFDGTWTTKDIAEHFKLTIPQVAAWFQRSDIAAIIDFVAAANERRARDIARENLPGTIDILHRISRLRNDDKVARAASSALINFSRGRSSTSLIRKAKTARPADGTCDFSTAARARRAGETPPRGMHDTRDSYSTADSDHHDEFTQSAPPQATPGRDAESSLPAREEPVACTHTDPSTTDHSIATAAGPNHASLNDPAQDLPDPPSAFQRIASALAPHAPSRGSPADLVARAGTTRAPAPDVSLPVLQSPNSLGAPANRSITDTPARRNSCCTSAPAVACYKSAG